MKKTLAIFITLLVASLIWVVFFWQPEKEHVTLDSSGNMTGGDFTLQSIAGPVSLSEFHGKVVLIYFGYTWCPDICPTNLAMMAGALSQLSEHEKNRVQGIFVSVDPERDSVERLATYTDFFHPTIIGLTGTENIINDITTRYGAAYQIIKQDSATDYVVDHSSETYLVDPDGKLAEKLPHAALPDQILMSVRKYF
ncbi:MAG: SCO family protein [Gammaproteobacteria bacterium]|nr:SCO family protein [Gammaproteobacteria bacterium]